MWVFFEFIQVEIEVPDAIVVAHSLSMKWDPVTNRKYYVPTGRARATAAMRGSIIDSRLTQKPTDSPDLVQKRLGIYREHIVHVLPMFKEMHRRFILLSGHFLEEPQVLNDIVFFLIDIDCFFGNTR